jgi:serine/threonine protein kinase
MLAPETILQGRYRVVRQLGQGGMGAVYEAVDQRLDTVVALKETFFADERLRKQFEREARLLARLHHPALPRVSDHFSEGDGQFLVMQYIPGDDLSEMMNRKSGPFPPHQVLTWADQLLDALDYLHTQDPQIVHRDIKPQNLKLTSRGQIILLDFGLAKGQSGEISKVTTSASIFGYTPNYAPLEQIQGLGTDSRSDLYSLAATIYHLLTGIKPPDALSRAAAIVNAQPDPLQPAHEANNLVAPEVSEVLKRSMSQNRDQRYASAADMRRALQGSDQAATVTSTGEAQTVIMQGARTASAQPAAASTNMAAPQATIAAGETTVLRPIPVASKRSAVPWVLGGAAALVLLCGGLAWLAFRSKEPAVVQVATTPTPTPAQSISNPSSEPGSTVNERAAQQTPSAASEHPKKVEKPTRSEERREESKRPTVEPPPAPTAQPTPNQGHNERPVNPPDVPNPTPDPNRGPRPNIQRGPDGTMIRNFPDGSKLIQLPDGTRMYIDAKGRRIVYPNPKMNPNRRRPQNPNP